jgi:protein-S-isoprenylcysteine O-methyltransferase Ste14
MFLIIWSLDSFVLKFFEGHTFFASLPLRLGLFLFILLVALFLIKTSHDPIVSSIESKSLVTNGPYAYVRHPMYLGPLLIYLSLTFLTMSFISFILLVVIFFLYNFLVTDEEKDLERIFGQEYIIYKKRVARWIPKIY